MDDEHKYRRLTPKQACEYFNVSYKTIDRWANSGKINFTIDTTNGHRRFVIPINESSKKSFIYARVSSKKQSDDLQRQISFITKQIKNVPVITDIGSAFNFNRKGFQYILEELYKGNIDKVYISEPDRFARISFEFFEWMFKHFGAELIYLSTEDKNNSTYEYEFSKDIIGIITHYTAKFHGKRKYETNKHIAKNIKNKNLSKQNPKTIPKKLFGNL